MRNFLSCVHKDLKIFGRSKFSAIVAVLVPLLIVLLVGAAFSSSDLQGVRISTYSSSYNELTNSIIANFEEQSFKVTKEEGLESCINTVKTGESQICVVFPGDLSAEGNNASVEFHVDKSRINLAYILVEEVRTEVQSKSSELSLGLVNDLITTLQDARTSLEAQKATLGEAASGASNIGSKANSAAKPDLSTVISKLQKAKTLAGDMNGSSSLQTEINAALTEANTVSGKLDVFSDDLDSIGQDSSEIQSKISGVSTNIDNVLGALNGFKVTEAEKIISPINTEIKSVVDETTNWEFVFPTLLALMVLFGSTILASVMALRDKQSRAYFRNFITPTSDFTFLIAMYVSSILILFVQSLVLFAGLSLITDFDVLAFVGPLALVLFVSATMFIFMGIFIGHLFRSEEAVILVAISIVSLMLFFSNAILPIESILGRFQWIAAYNPFVVASSMLKKTILFGQGIPAMLPELYILLISFVVFFVLALVARESTRRHVY